MKIVVTSGLSFKPQTLPPQIDFSGARDGKGKPIAITPGTLLAALNATNPGPLYVAGEPGLGGKWQGPGLAPTLLALQAPTIGMKSTDQIIVIIDDGREAAGDDTLIAFATAAHLDAVDVKTILDTLATEHTLEGLDDDLNNFAAHNHADIVAASDRNHVDITTASDRNHVDIGKLDTDLNTASATAHTDSGRLDTDLVSFAGANHADLGRIEMLLAAQRQETLWTDDSRAYFVRLDTRGTITWTDLSGNAGPAPGVGARPAAGDDALLDKSSYQAINAGAGYAVGDLLDHVITTDPKSGTIVGHFWLNLSQETTIAAPAVADIEPLSRLPDDAARASLQNSIAVTAHADAQKLDTDLNAASDRNHADLVALGTGATTNAAQAHTDSGQLDTDLKAFAGANHTDMGTLAAATGAPGDAPAPDDVAAASIIALLRRSLTRWTNFLGRFPAALGPSAAAGALPVTLATDGVFVTTIGGTTDAAAASDTAASSLMGLLRRGVGNWTTLLLRIPALGPALKAGAVPVTVASDQVVPVSGSAAAGAAPTQPPLSVSGVDAGGLKRHFLTDTAGVLQASDLNSAAFSTAALLTAGQPAPAARSVGVNATAGGTVTLTLAGSGSIALPVFAGWQTFPFAATAFAFSNGAAGAVYNLA